MITLDDEEETSYASRKGFTDNSDPGITKLKLGKRAEELPEAKDEMPKEVPKPLKTMKSQQKHFTYF